MNKKHFEDVATNRKKLRTFWKEEIERLKYDIRKTENKINGTEHSSLIEKANFLQEIKKADSVKNFSNSVNLYSPVSAENQIMPDKKITQPQRTATARSDHHQYENVNVEDKDFNSGELEWVSATQLLGTPADAAKRRKIKGDAAENLFAGNLESSFDLDCGSSIISLDFGLVSPKKIWSSPPQRIERARNREWSSPHRIIHRPNPENSPGNWVTFKESRLHSLATAATNVINKIDNPQEASRSISQATYTVPEKLNTSAVLPRNQAQTIRITSVLQEYEPEKKNFRKKTGASYEPEENKFVPSREKVKRLVEPDGHVIKISLLNDFEVPSFGKLAEKISGSTEAEKISAESPPKNPKSNISTKTKATSNLKTVTSKLHPLKPTKPKETRKIEEEISSRNETKKEDEKLKENEIELNSCKKNEVAEEKEKDVQNTKQVIKDLEEILRGSIKNEEEKATEETDKIKNKVKKPKLFKKHLFQAVEEKPIVLMERKKRYNDEKVQEYIKSQKQKRIEQMKTEKRSKVAEKEARKKKLEELRIRTLKLAAQSKKKKAPELVVETVEQGTEDDVTMSLGLKQIKPKVSYNESISNLKKKTNSTKGQSSKIQMETLSDEGEKSEKEEKEDIKMVQAQINTENLIKPEEIVRTDFKPQNDINAALKKLAETLHMKMEEKKKQVRSKSSPSVFNSKTDIPQLVPSKESLKSVQTMPESNRQMIAVDIDTIHSLKEDIKKISENFKVLHEIIIEKTDLIEEKPIKESIKESESKLKEEVKTNPSSHHEETETIPLWLKNMLPKPHPYNVCTAFKHKMNVKTSGSVSSQENSESISKKSFKSLSTPIDPLGSVKHVIQKITSQSSNQISDTSEENYFTFKEDSGSELSSSILDSDNRSVTSVQVKEQTLIFPTSGSSKRDNNDKGSATSSTITEITRSIQLETSKSSISSKSVISRLSNNRDNMVLVTPDIKLISNDLGEKKLNNSGSNINFLYKSISTSSKNSVRPEILDELNNSESKSNKDQKSDSVIAEMIDNLSENEKSCKSLKSINEKPQNNVQRLDDCQRRSFFQPEMLHLQFQAELTLLETFQQSLSRFLEVERLKTLTEVNKIVNEKAIKAEPAIQKEDQAVQTTFQKYEPQNEEDVNKTETESVKTEISISEESLKTEKTVSKRKSIEEGEKEISEISENVNKKSVNDSEEKSKKEDEETHSIENNYKNVESFDVSSGQNGISFQMLDRIMKDEELRSEHQLALIRLREKTLNDKVKAELTFLEMKKKSFKERGDKEQNISAIRKKQRGILMKYQSEKEEIERLKKMHKIASEERKIMITQQKQIQQMQSFTKDMIIKLKKREKSPLKKTLKSTALIHSDSESDIEEDIPEVISDSVVTESVRSLEDSSIHSNGSELEISFKSKASEKVHEVPRKILKHLERRNVTERDNKLKFKTDTNLAKRYSVDELLKWTKRLKEKERRLQELEREKSVVDASKKKLAFQKRISMKDRSVSPFQFPETIKSITEITPSISELIEPKKSSTISEVIAESITKTISTEKSESGPEKVQSSISEEIPEEFSKNVNASISKTMEYNSESFESLSSSEATKIKSVTPRSRSGNVDGNNKNMPVKLSLSPKIQSCKRRYSSGSEDSLNFSLNETASEQSDLECRIAALYEQLRKRKLEAERLRREQKKVQREKLQVKEQSLLNQIKAYDAYIQKKKQELKQEYEHTSKVVVKPLIKQPKISKKSNLKLSELVLNDSLKVKEKEDVSFSGKISESDSEIQEVIKEISESIKEDIKVSQESVQEDLESLKDRTESKIEEELDSKNAEAITDSKTLPTETSDTTKSNDFSESISEQGECDKSQSESEEQSLSVKTTLHSPIEKPENDFVETVEATESIQSEGKSPEKETLAEDAYQFDSFESDMEEIQSAKSSEIQKQSDSKTIPSEIEIESLSQIEEKEEVEEENASFMEKKSSSISYDSNVSEALPEALEKTEKVEKISDFIIFDLIKESLDIFSSRKEQVEEKLKKESKLNVEMLSSILAKEIIAEAVDDMLKIYNRKAVFKEEEAPISPDRLTSDIKKKISEIIIQSGEKKVGAVSPQRMMITTFDITPVGSPTEEESEEVRDEFLRSINAAPREKDKEAEGNHEENKTENEGQEWLDDDLNLSRAKREAEELRLQQLQIEQEIQQLQAQQERVPYFYLREIPNKPPPPYTPPGKLPSEIPTSQSDIMTITKSAVRILIDELNKGKAMADIKPNRNFYGNVTNEHVRCYKLFLFDLAKHIIEDVFKHQEKKEEVVPWMKTRERLSLFKYKNVERTLECLNELVEKQVLTLFGFGKKIGKESLIDRWIRKKRDHVDEILVGESQVEESQWTDYDEDQVAVKNEVALAILDNLLEESAELVNDIFNKKMKNVK